MLGSYSYYVEDQIATARADNAPQNAIYKQANGKWRTFDQVSQGTRIIINGLVPHFQKAKEK
jgi:hypothetical protein